MTNQRDGNFEATLQSLDHQQQPNITRRLTDLSQPSGLSKLRAHGELKPLFARIGATVRRARKVSITLYFRKYELRTSYSDCIATGTGTNKRLTRTIRASNYVS